MENIIYKIYENNKNIEYGWKDKKGNIHSHINEGYVKNFKFQTPEELLKSQCGNCWETVELTRKLLEENNLPAKAYFFVIPTCEFYCHSIAVTNIDNNYYWIENSFKNMKGVREYNSLEELIYDVLNNFHKIIHKEKVNYKHVKIYEYDKPKEHINI